MYVLDTNTIIYFFKGMGSVADRILSQSPKDLSIPAVVLYELEVGIGKSTSPKKRRDQLTELLSLSSVLPFGESEATATASIRVRLEKLGDPIGPTDYLIAGTALANQAILVTRNKKEFERIRNLRVEDWF